MNTADASLGDACDMADFEWTSASRSHPGRVRKVNEDACLDQPARGLWAVADGMGGHSLGEFASRLAVKSLMDLSAPSNMQQYVADVQQRLQEANRRLRSEAARRDVMVIGTTIAVLLASQRHCTCLWAGDSRIYLYRKGRLKRLTRDHSQLEAFRTRHANSSADDTLDRPPSNLITRALGGADSLEIDAVTVEVEDGDVFLLCSDGLSNEVSESAIEEALFAGNCRQASQVLLDLALEGGGRDNISAIVVRAEDPCSPDRTVIQPMP